MRLLAPVVAGHPEGVGHREGVGHLEGADLVVVGHPRVAEVGHRPVVADQHFERAGGQQRGQALVCCRCLPSGL